MPLYDGCNSADDAVIVSFNYRLGPLGFMTLGDAGIEGNMAIKDYVKALEWVLANIASFGGDASQVLLFGQSAGGSDTFVVSTLPQAKSLMKSAAIQSGGSQDLVDRHAADTVGASFAETLGCSRSDVSLKRQFSCGICFSVFFVTNLSLVEMSAVQDSSAADGCYSQDPCLGQQHCRNFNLWR